MHWEVAVFSIWVAGPRGGVCSLPHGGWESIHLRVQLCLAQLFHPGVPEHSSLQIYGSEDSRRGGSGVSSAMS